MRTLQYVTSPLHVSTLLSHMHGLYFSLPSNLKKYVRVPEASADFLASAPVAPVDHCLSVSALLYDELTIILQTSASPQLYPRVLPASLTPL